ncbi:hypothetical protein C5167_039936 [Papaver somniferum]|uniref:Uncharacterized protein n=1 Tax=Papaver somniferum TaxID=3469 RepID=A0A4Y7IH35_PAPSO|nr:gamma-interferon-responsive lysosomal thiol protein-like [Papaver somniferum]RZC47002.1 hypothetical protein C5167_039936 [Papaver somniferum]
MASSPFSNLLLFSILFLTFCNACFSSQSPSHEKVSSESAPAQKVSLSVFCDSFSVESANFILVNLSKVHETGLSEIVDLRLVPFGSAVLLKNGTITCRFEYECQLNILEGCVLHFLPPIEQYQFMSCLSDYVIRRNPDLWEFCLDNKYEEPTFSCIKSPLSRKIQLLYANETSALNPPPEFFPWVTINQAAIPRTLDFDIMESICKAYTGYYVVCQNMGIMPAEVPSFQSRS